MTKTNRNRKVFFKFVTEHHERISFGSSYNEAYEVWDRIFTDIVAKVSKMLSIHKITSSFQTDKNCERIISRQLLKQHRNFKLQNRYVSHKILCSNKTMTTVLQTRRKYAPCYQWSMGELKNKQFRRFL